MGMIWSILLSALQVGLGTFTVLAVKMGKTAQVMREQGIPESEVDGLYRTMGVPTLVVILRNALLIGVPLGVLIGYLF